jgi:L-2,4-diaminobutyric acid acetyltransferase
MRKPMQTEVYRSGNFVLRPPRVEDGERIWRFVGASETLDLNSPYCYLILCHHFADTCLVAEEDNALIGFIVGYRPPKAKNVVVVWQIGVAASRQGRGLGLAMLRELLRRDACGDVSFLEATVTPSNSASRAMFTAFARSLNAEWMLLTGFDAALFPKEVNHEAELLLRIGPFAREGRRQRLAVNPS